MPFLFLENTVYITLPIIQVVAGNFGLIAGSAVALTSGTSTPIASGNTPQFLYNTSNGALYFDQDGAENAYQAIQLATLIGQKTLISSDIIVVSM